MPMKWALGSSFLLIMAAIPRPHYEHASPPFRPATLLARPLTKMFHFGTAKNFEQKKICRKADN
jgi:hypothetical protein